MPIYLVIVNPDRAAKMIEEKFSDEDRCEVRPGVWFVRSATTSSEGVAKTIGIDAERHGVVVTAEFYKGYASSGVVETLRRWEAASDA